MLCQIFKNLCVVILKKDKSSYSDNGNNKNRVTHQFFCFFNLTQYSSLLCVNNMVKAFHIIEFSLIFF